LVCISHRPQDNQFHHQMLELHLPKLHLLVPQKPSVTSLLLSGGVRAPYSGSLTLEYTAPTGSDPAEINLSSAQLDASDPACQSSPNYGGVLEAVHINRYRTE
jgi:hypothetical protein